jgi:hypothetical protein
VLKGKSGSKVRILAPGRMGFALKSCSKFSMGLTSQVLAHIMTQFSVCFWKMQSKLRTWLLGDLLSALSLKQINSVSTPTIGFISAPDMADPPTYSCSFFYTSGCLAAQLSRHLADTYLLHFCVPGLLAKSA